MVGGLLVVAGLVGGWVLWSAEPQGQAFYPRCHFHGMTGWLCPGCGSTRAAHHLIHGDVVAALRSNAPLVLALPFLAFWGWKAWRGERFEHRFTGKWAVAVLSILVVFSVLRNVPGPQRAWLSPPPPVAKATAPPWAGSSGLQNHPNPIPK